MPIKTVISTRPATFGDMRDAMDAASAFEASTEDHYQYEMSFVFNGEREVIGVQVRLKDLDGFGAGYVALA